jgi:1-acyl-sn-glycerol-3-phosphate acyltransferase
MVKVKQDLSERSATQERVLKLIRELLSELGSERALRSLSLQSSLDRDLGIGSLERLELMLRLEKAFSIRLADNAMTQAETPLDLANALLRHDFVSQEARVPDSLLDQPSAAFDQDSASTLGEVLCGYAQLEAQRSHVRLRQADREVDAIRYGELFSGASAVAAGLIENGLERGETVAIMLPTGKEFFLAFFGILLAGGVAVPIYPPFRADRLEEYAQRQSLILRDAEVRALITFQRAEGLLRLLRSRIPSLSTVTTVAALSGAPLRGTVQSAKSDIALIQYTSGSTGNPKGVALTHANLIANIRAIGRAIDVRPTDVGVSWLPLYHDMGLIGSWLFCLYFGIPIVILSPVDFLNRPERWLWAIHHYRGSLSAAPNFAYELCASKVDAKVLEGLDLSCWRAAFNGAEPVSVDTLQRFIKRFRAYGFRPESMLPVYGLAESSVALAVPQLKAGYRVDAVDRRKFEVEGKAVPADSESSALRFVSAGRPLAGHEIRVVSDTGFPLEERVQGNIEFKGPSTMVGYFGNPEATSNVCRNGWVDTGDLGYLADEEIFVTSRRKDMIIKGGRNLFPQEIEEIVGSVTGVRKGCVAVFGVNEARMGTERLIVVAETRETARSVSDGIASAIVERVDACVGMPPDVVELVGPHTVPKTSSGKIRRDACRTLYLQGRLARRPSPVWLQWVKIVAASGQDWIHLSIRQVVGIAYGGYAWMVFLALLILGWFVITLVPSGRGYRRANQILRLLCRAWLWSVGLTPKVEGQQNLIQIQRCREQNEPLLVVSNHASYLDPIVLAATIPFKLRFVVKREAFHWPVIGSFLRRCGAIAILRNNPSSASDESRKIILALREGAAVHIFPEGTFTAHAGVRPFQMGGFKAALETGSQVVPVALSGTRKVLRDGKWLASWGRIRVVVSPPLRTRSADWAGMVRIRDDARAEILKQCGENSLNLVRAGLPREQN